MMRATLLIILLLLPAWCSLASAEIGPDMYQKVAEYQFADARTAASNGEYLYLLFGSSIGVTDLYSPGIKLPIMRSFKLDEDYTGAVRQGDWLYSYAWKGWIAVAHLFGDQVVVISETLAADSVLSLAATPRYLFCASGFGGILIIDAGNRSHPRLVGRENHGVYYSHVKIDGDRLFAVDAFNGVDVFSIAGADLTYKTTLRTPRPPSGEVVIGNKVHVWYGGTALDRFILSDHDSLEGAMRVLTTRKIKTVASIGENLILAFEEGTLALYSLDDKVVLDTLRLPFPAQMIESPTYQDYGDVAVVDVTGNVRIVGVGSTGFGDQRIVDMPSAPQFLLPLSDRVLAASSSGGIDSYQVAYRRIERRSLYPAAPVYSALTFSDSLLFAADNGTGQIAVYDLRSSSPLPMSELDISLPSFKLYSYPHGDGNYDIISVGAGGAEAVKYVAASCLTDSQWEIRSETPIVTGFWQNGLLGLITDRDTLRLYLAPIDESNTELVAEFSLPESTRCAAYFQDRYLVLGSKDYVSINELVIPYDKFITLKELTTVSDARDLAYDGERETMLVADGEEGVKYFDFSAPSDFSDVYPIIASGTVSRLRVSSDYLVALGRQGLTAYSARSSSPPTPGLPQTYYVSQNYPNPFNGSTNIEIAARPGEVLSAPLTFEVYNVLGQLVLEQKVAPASGRLRITWDGRDSNNHQLSSGLYFLRLRFGDSDVVRKALLLK
jgi:hypothetical protein